MVCLDIRQIMSNLSSRVISLIALMLGIMHSSAKLAFAGVAPKIKSLCSVRGTETGVLMEILSTVERIANELQQCQHKGAIWGHPDKYGLGGFNLSFHDPKSKHVRLKCRLWI